MEHDGGNGGGGGQWGRRQEMLAKKPEQDTALERPGFMLRRERGDRGMERAWGLERGQPGQGGEGQESCTMGISRHEKNRLEERERKGGGSRVARASLQ